MIRKITPGILAVVASTVFTCAVFNQLPERVASHWGADGTANGWTSRVAFVLLIPIIATVVSAVLLLAPDHDTRPGKFESHEGSYWLIVNATLFLMALGNVLATGVNIGWNVRIEWLGYGLGAYLMTFGNVLTRVRPNGIFGLRTPWTLSSERSWRATHRLAGYGVVVVGASLVLANALRPGAMFTVLISGLLGVGVISFVYSYFASTSDRALR